MLTEEAKKAQAEYQKKYRTKNASRLRAYKRKWSRENPEKVKEYQNKYWNKKGECLNEQ